MARIRSIKPEFWTDEKIVRLPYEARLLFIGLWNFADDDGLVWDEPERIQMQVLPRDDVDAAAMLDLLVAAELLDRFVTTDGRTFLSIRRFADHQKVSNPSPSKIPREGSRKLVIPQHVRRAVATKYGCPPGETKDVTCYYCGEPGVIVWQRLHSGRPGAWVALTLELDHMEPESSGGSTSDPGNFVLACRTCNRSKGPRHGIDWLAASTGGLPESASELQEGSRGILTARPGREGKGLGRESIGSSRVRTSGDPYDPTDKTDERRRAELIARREVATQKAIAEASAAPAVVEPPANPLAGWGRHLAGVPVGALPEAWRCAEAAFAAWYRQRRRLPWKASAASGRALRGLAVAIADTAAATGLTEEAVIDRALANFGADPFAVTSDFPPALLETKWGAYFDPPEIPRPKGAMHPCPPPGAHGNDLADQLGLGVVNG